MLENHSFLTVGPVLIERRCGGWLAITPRHWPLGIGVTAPTKAEAAKKFQEELKRLSEIPDLPE